MDIFEEMKKMQKRMFEDFYRRPMFRLSSSDWPEEKELAKFDAPAADFKETDKELVAEFDLPGVGKEDIKLQVTENEIEVKAEKKHEVETKKEGLFHQERAYQGFYRKNSLPKKVKPEEVEAEFKNGVLTVKMPKKEIEQKKRKEIEVKVK